MRIIKRIPAFLLALILLTLTACSANTPQTTPAPEPSPPPSQTDVNAPTTPNPANNTNINKPADFDTLVEQYRTEGWLVQDTYNGELMENTSYLAEWVINYQHGLGNTLAVYLYAYGMGDALYILESKSDSAEYTITIHTKGAAGALETAIYKSSMIVERAYDYVLGADIPSKERQHAIVLHHSVPVGVVEGLKIQELRQLHGISSAEAVARAENIEGRIYTSASVGYTGGYYFKADAVKPLPEGYVRPAFKAVGIVRLQERLCYLIYGNTDKVALERGEHSGTVYAVSADGALVFTQSMEGGEWILTDDANQAVYPGTWPYISDFEAKAKAMGYTDAQLDLLNSPGWGSANVALNLSEMGNYSESLPTYDRYELDGYLVSAGGEAMTTCMYLRDNYSGKVTILPDWQNGYSSFAFLDETTFYAGIAQVGGADYEAGVRFYNAESPAEPYARWDLTDSSVQSDMEKILVNTLHEKTSGLLAAFWCEIPASWGGWVNEDTQTYQVTILEKSGAVQNSFDTGLKLVTGHLGIQRPDYSKSAESLASMTDSIYFDIADDTYSLNLKSGEVNLLSKPE